MKRSEIKRDLAKLVAWHRRRAPIAKVSTKRREWLREYRAARIETLARDGYVCRAQLPGCTRFANEVHHLAGRVGKDANDHDNLISLCASCHRQVTLHEVDVYALGLAKKRLGRHVKIVPGPGSCTPPRDPAGDGSADLPGANAVAPTTLETPRALSPLGARLATVPTTRTLPADPPGGGQKPDDTPTSHAPAGFLGARL